MKNKKLGKDDCDKTIVSIALATDKNYYAPILVAIKSIVLNSSENYDYRIYILSDSAVNIFQKNIYLSTIENKVNFKMFFIAVGDQVGSVRLSEKGPTKGITQATYYRFLLPNLLKNTSKIVYMDADTVVLDDIAHIYSNDIGDCYVGGVRDIVGYQDKKTRCQELNIDNLEQYINAGVLLMNLDEFRKNNLSEEMLKLAAEKSFPYNDQDIINSICYGRIKCLPLKCNVIIDYLEKPNEISKVLNIDYAKEAKEPIILHYAGRTKPWYSNKGQFTHYWWDVVNSFRLHIKLLIKYGARKLKKRSWKT